MNSVNHLAVILDGNRRFAKKRGMAPWKGHEEGAKNVARLLKWCEELDIRNLTLYALSVDNLKRSKQEVSFMMGLFDRFFEELEKKPDVHEKKVRIRFLGRTGLLPGRIQEKIKKVEESTKSYDRYFANFCVAYGGREEISDAFKKMASDVSRGVLSPGEIGDESVKKYLYMPDEPDLIIRTGGEKRLSGFLLYQCSYSELFFLDKHWPEFTKADLEKCLADFRNRRRNFGR